MKNLSLHLRLIISFLSLSIFVWLFSALLSWHEIKEQMDEFFDTYQVSLATQLSSADWQNISPEVQERTNNIIKNLGDEGEYEDEALGFAVFSKDGKMIFNDGEEGKYFPFNPVSGFDNQKLVGKKSSKWRMFWIESYDHKYFIVVGQELDFRRETSIEMIIQTLSPWSIGLLLLIIFSIYLVSKEIKPIKSITKNLSRRKANDFSEVQISNVPKEISPLISALNNQFKRIEHMMTNERSFISDAAHELKSPLAALKVQLEVAMMSDDDEKTRNHALGKLNEGIERYHHLVEQLLALSKIESNSINLQSTELDWNKIVELLLDEYITAIKQKNITIEKSISKKSPIEKGNFVLCCLLIRNLLDNAIKYCPENSKVSISITSSEIRVSNEAEINEEHIKRLGERFFRPAGQKEKGSGLGLSIAKKIVQTHNCSINYKYENNLFSVIIKNN